MNTTQLNNHQLGQRGEDMAAAELQQRGYTILARNYRRDRGEIDIIAIRGDTTSFIEVKSRHRSELRPSVNVTPAKRRQITKVAQIWFAEQGCETVCEFLIAEVNLDNGDINIFADFMI